MVLNAGECEEDLRQLYGGYGAGAGEEKVRGVRTTMVCGTEGWSHGGGRQVHGNSLDLNEGEAVDVMLISVEKSFILKTKREGGRGSSVSP